ncbi:MAG: Cytochrome c2 [Rhodospirillales bacterium]|nr:Cytochrome c2 [Rhodospirillales bacterium]
MMQHKAAALVLFASCFAAGVARAECAEDLTRVQLAMAKAAPDVQARLQPLVATAIDKAKAKDAAGCDQAMGEALQILQLPKLPPLQLSTPMATGDAPGRAGKPSDPTSQTQRASPDPRAGQPAQPQQQAAQPPASEQQAQQQPPQAPPKQAQQQQAQPQQPAASQADSAPLFLSARDLIGTPVVSQEDLGRTVGKVSNVIFDRGTGRVSYVILEWGGFLGWDRRHVLVPYSLLAFSGRWDRPRLRAPSSKIENAPQVREKDIEALLGDPDWRRAIADYFRTDEGAPASSAGGNAAPSGPSASAQPATGGGATSDPKANPGEGATGPTAGSGHEAGAATTTPVAASVASGGADLKNGQALASRACAACHTLNPGGSTRVGPNLAGVVGRPIASVPGFNYSAALKKHQGIWDAGNLDGFLKNPRSWAPGTFMTFPGIPKDDDRRDVVAYLQSIKGGGK